MNYESYIHSLLEPDEKLRTGRKKKRSSTLFQQIKLIEKYREELGEEEFLKRCKEYDEWFKRKLTNG